MIVRILVGIVFITLAIGFLWFFAQVMYLGIREFFKSKTAIAMPSTTSSKTKTKKTTP